MTKEKLDLVRCYNAMFKVVTGGSLEDFIKAEAQNILKEKAQLKEDHERLKEERESELFD